MKLSVSRMDETTLDAHPFSQIDRKRITLPCGPSQALNHVTLFATLPRRRRRNASR